MHGCIPILGLPCNESDKPISGKISEARPRQWGTANIAPPGALVLSSKPRKHPVSQRLEDNIYAPINVRPHYVPPWQGWEFVRLFPEFYSPSMVNIIQALCRDL